MKTGKFILLLACFYFIALTGLKNASADSSYNLRPNSVIFPANKNPVSSSLKRIPFKSGVYSIIDSFNVYYSVDYMHYAEYNGSGVYSGVNASAGTAVDTEEGGLPGFGLSYESVLSDVPLWYRANFSNNAGNSTYTSLKVNPSTRQINGYSSAINHLQYISYGIGAGYVFTPVYNVAVIPNIGYEWIHWNRNIITSNEIEHYRLDYWFIGLKSYYLINDNLWIEGEAYYTKSINNIMAASDEPSAVKLGNKAGYLLGAKIGYKLYQSGRFNISPFIGIRYSQNKEGASNRLPASGGGIWWEPADQYNQLWVNIGFKFGF